MSNKITKVSVHPLSRKSKEKKRMMLRELRLTAQKSTVTHDKHVPLINRLTWFQLYLADHTKPPTLPEIQDAIKEYVERNKDDMQRLQGEVRKDRPAPKKLKEMEELRTLEMKEYSTSGIELPRMLAAKDFDAFQLWNGDYNCLKQLCMTKYIIKH